MSQSDTAHAWWSRLRHQGLLLSPVVMIERYPSVPPPASWHAKERLRSAHIRFATTLGDGDERDQAAVLALVDSLVENFIGHSASQFVKQHSIPEKLTVAVRIGTRSETLRPHRILYASDNHETPALLALADSSPHVGRGRGRTAYARFLELLRGTGCRLGLLTNGQQFRLIYAGLDFESWCEWESERWFDDGEGTEELCGLCQLLAPEAVEDATVGVAGLLSAVEESRKRQADLSSVLRENVRQAVELILEEVSTANRVQSDLFTPLVQCGDDRKLTDTEAHEALMQATVRVVMRLVVCLFAESRQLLPINDPIYASSYGVRSLYELLDEAARQEGGTYVLFNRQTAWPRLMALCRLIHGGSAHGAFPLRAYGGALFRPGDEASADPVARALHILEHKVSVGDAAIYHVLRKLLRGPLPVLRGRAKTFVEGPVDYTDLRTEFVGLIYEGLLDYRLKRTDEQIGPQVFLNLGREPVLPLSRLTEMLANDKKGLKDLLTTLRKEVVGSSILDVGEDDEDDGVEAGEREDRQTPEADLEIESEATIHHPPSTIDAYQAALSWAKEAAVLAGIVPKQKKKQTDAEYQTVIEAEANRLIKRVVAIGEFYLVRAGNTRKGTGTFYTRPQLAVPTVHRTLEPLCYVVARDSWVVDRKGVDGQNEKGDVHASAELSRPSSVAAGDGPRDLGLSAHGAVSQGGNVRLDQPGAAGGRVDSVERRGGAGTKNDGGVSEPTVCGERVDHGSPDSIGDRSPTDVPARQRSDISSGCRDTSCADDERADQCAGTKTLTPRTPEEILSLKVCDPACGSASFLVAALHYLTDALYRSLCYHRHLDNPERAPRLTLPYGHPRSPTHDPRFSTHELVPFPPDDPQRGDTFEERTKALLRRHVVERCIYGVDINPLAVELARVSLWVETLDPELPFSFLDHKIKVGNSLVGCWLDRVEDYPLRAWEREGGDGPKGERTQRIEELLKGEFVGKRRSGDGRIKKEMRQVIESRFSKKAPLFPDMQLTTENVVSEARAKYEGLHELPMTDPDEREHYYRERVENSPAIRALKAAMDEWCAVWFWPADAESLGHVPTPFGFHKGTPSKDAIIERLAGDLRFFHWELEFPDVFTPARAGFSAVLGNPPWDVMKPNSQEFFTEFEPLYRTLDKQAALRRQKQLFGQSPRVAHQWSEYNARFKSLGNWAKNVAEPFDVALARGDEGSGLAQRWTECRAQRITYADRQHPFRLQGSADLNSYKMFTELFWNLLQRDGRIGIILPTGIYSDFGTKDLREELMERGRIDLLYAFQNEKRVFAGAHHSFKQVALMATRGGTTHVLRTRFRMGVGDSPHAHELPDDILRQDTRAMAFTPEDIRRNSPKTGSLVELRSHRDLNIFRKIYDHSFRIGDNAPGWEITYATEFHMTNDSKHFPPLEKWEGRGYKPDVFGRWVGPEGHVALPLYQGGMVHILDPFFNGWLAGSWKELNADDKRPQPKYLMRGDDYRRLSECASRSRIAYRRIARTTDTRTFICTFSPPLPSGDSLFLLLLASDDLARQIVASAVLGSLTFDSIIRERLSGTNLSWFVLQECPLPQRIENQGHRHAFLRVLQNGCSLSLIHRRFATEWLKLKCRYPELVERQWKHWWAVTEADRLRLRVELDALCADLYGLDPDDFYWILRDDKTDPKGFYRVDRDLPFRERLTGLAGAAFRALKEGKWSAETAAGLSNDEFFEILGIPELTGAEVAKAKGLPGPLIQKRDGCHDWKPENFPENDPRHGWTWDHCRKDAVALLGSEEAVHKCVEGTPEDAVDKEPVSTGQKDLFGDPIPTDLFGNEIRKKSKRKKRR